MLTSAPARIGEFYHRLTAIPSSEEEPKIGQEADREAAAEGTHVMEIIFVRA